MVALWPSRRWRRYLTGKLATIAVLAPSAPQRPWAGDREAGKPARIFEDLRGRVYQTPQRERAAAARRLGTRRASTERAETVRRAAATMRRAVATG